MATAVFVLPNSARSQFISTLVKKRGLPINIKIGETDEYDTDFPPHMRPVLLTADGAALTETIAIAYYLVGETEYFGGSPWEKCQVLSWLSFVNSELLAGMHALLDVQEDFKKLSANARSVVTHLRYLDARFREQDFLEGERETACDVFLYFALKELFGLFSNVCGQLTGYEALNQWCSIMEESLECV